MTLLAQQPINTLMNKYQFRAMGTTITLEINHLFADYLFEEAKEKLLDYEKRFSANDPNSLLMQINRFAGQKAVQVDTELFELIKFGKRHSLNPTTTLNIAVGPLVKLWKIGFEGARLPQTSEIDARLELIDPHLITLSEEDSSVYLEKQGMEIDLGALAKGYFADKIKSLFVEAGVTEGLINLGGNILLIGSHPLHSDGLWRIGVQNPKKDRHETIGMLFVRDQSIVTSGIYERTLEIKGESYHHIFDTNTGYPVKNDLASLTVITKKSLDAELYTTLYYNRMSDEVIASIDAIAGVEAVVITRAGDVLLSKGAAEIFIKG